MMAAGMMTQARTELPEALVEVSSVGRHEPMRLGLFTGFSWPSAKPMRLGLFKADALGAWQHPSSTLQLIAYTFKFLLHATGEFSVFRLACVHFAFSWGVHGPFSSDSSGVPSESVASSPCACCCWFLGPAKLIGAFYMSAEWAWMYRSEARSSGVAE